jgi:hypothetical protein
MRMRTPAPQKEAAAQLRQLSHAAVAWCFVKHVCLDAAPSTAAALRLVMNLAPCNLEVSKNDVEPSTTA